MKKKKTEKPHYVGHRQRVRDKFTKNGPETFTDYEILELLLFETQNRKDMKPIAKNLLNKFKTLSAVFKADINKLMEIKGVGKETAHKIKVMQAAFNRSQQSELMKTNIVDEKNKSPELNFSKFAKVATYCINVMGSEVNEQFRVLFLNKKNELVADELLHVGTKEHMLIDVRKIIQKADNIPATAMILVHNHPSGNTQPSTEDIEMTKHIQESVALFNLIVHDHIIVTKKECVSMKQLGLM